MANLTNKPQMPQPGDDLISARVLDALKDQLPRQITGARPIEVRWFGDRCIIGLGKVATPTGSPETRLCVVREEFDDYLLCAPFHYGSSPHVHDPNEGADPEGQFYVAKPRLLQKAPFDGQTVTIKGVDFVYTYTEIGEREVAIDGEDDEEPVTEKIVPAYFVGDIIMAKRVNTGLTAPEDRPISWEDTNEGGRSWLNEALAEPGQLFLAEIALSSGNGASTSYIVNIFDGRDYAATQGPYREDGVGVEAVQDDSPLRSFYAGELVVVRRRGGEWKIQKLFESTLRDSFEVGQLAVRLFSVVRPSSFNANLLFNKSIGSTRTIGYNLAGDSGASNINISDNNLALCDQLIDYKTLKDYLDANLAPTFHLLYISSSGNAAACYALRECVVPIVESKTGPQIIRSFADQQFNPFTQIGEVTASASINPLFDSIESDPSFSPDAVEGGDVVWTLNNNNLNFPSLNAPSSITFFGNTFDLGTDFGSGVNANLAWTTDDFPTSDISSSKVIKANFIPRVYIRSISITLRVSGNYPGSNVGSFGDVDTTSWSSGTASSSPFLFGFDANLTVSGSEAGITVSGGG